MLVFIDRTEFSSMKFPLTDNPIGQYFPMDKYF